MRTPIAAILIGGTTVLATPILSGQTTDLRFPFAPVHHLNAISLPDDWHKTLVTETGGLAYDFGPGPYARPFTEITVGLEGSTPVLLQQYYEDPRIPIALTQLACGADTLHLETFALIPPGDSLLPMRSGRGSVSRTNGLNGMRWWATPPPGTDPAFRGVAWGNNRSILYQVQVQPGSHKRVAFGLCEAYKSTPGARLLTLEVEGGESRTVDPLADGVKNRPSVYVLDGWDGDRDGKLRISVHAAPDSPDPNIILNAFWVFPEGAPIDPDRLIHGDPQQHAGLFWQCGSELEEFAPIPRIDAFRASLPDCDRDPAVRISSSRPLMFDATIGAVTCNGVPFLVTRPPPALASSSGDTLTLHYPAGTRKLDGVVIQGAAAGGAPVTVPDLSLERERAQRYWLHRAPVPKSCITVPDPRLQYLLETSIRNIYQVRDIVDGGIQFQPGPTVYRGLWLGDVFISGSTSLMAGDTGGVRLALEHGLRFQSPSGRFVSLRPGTSLAETPLFVVMMCRYAQFSGDDAWLRGHWKALVQGITWMVHMSDHTMDDPTLPYAGLMPPGFVDGGISHLAADYGTAWWAMIALEHALAAAKRLGIRKDIHMWADRLERMKAAFLVAAQRDRRMDAAGRPYLPITIGDTTSGLPPQRGQYAFLLPLPYGAFFRDGTPLLQEIIRDNLAMLDASREEGIILGSGWLHDGVWPWLGGIHALAHHTVGNDSMAYELVQAYADHATPLGTWVEEQQPRARGTRTTGDASNAEASAFYYQAVRMFLATERADSLMLMDGFPLQWLSPGMRTSMSGGGTAFGPVSVDLTVSPDGRSATLTVTSPPGRVRSGATVVHLESLRAAGFRDAAGRELAPTITIPWNVTVMLSLMRDL